MNVSDQNYHPLPDQHSVIELHIIVEFDLGTLAFDVSLPGNPNLYDDLYGAAHFVCFPFEYSPQVFAVAAYLNKDSSLVYESPTGLSNAPYHSHDGSF